MGPSFVEKKTFKYTANPMTQQLGHTTTLHNPEYPDNILNCTFNFFES